jgi:hypothetical protein
MSAGPFDQVARAPDGANPIEPSGPGGRKIAPAIARCLGVGDGRGQPATVWR